MRLLRPLWLLLFLLQAAAALADTGYTRVDLDADKQPRALQVAIVSFTKPGSDARVDLVSAIHVGDKAYYAELNQRFRDYDALLFELVAPTGANFSLPRGEHRGVLSTTQLGLTRLLGLTFQLDEIEYDRPNFVHADLSPAELRASMVERDESLYVYFWRIFFATMNEYGRDPLGLKDWEMLSSMVTAPESNSMKTMIAYEMADPRSVQNILGEDADTAIVGARNERAIAVLQRQLEAGSERIAIFYGVAHMADLERRLLELGFERGDSTWLDAWDLTGD